MQTIRIAAAIVRDEDGRFLLVRKRGSDIFFQPGGKIDPGETPEACVIREIAEELGVEVSSGQLSYAAAMSAPAANEADTIVEAELFHLTLKPDQVPFGCSEIEEVIWAYAGDDSRPIAQLSLNIQARFLLNER